MKMVAANGLGDLQRRKHQSARSVQNDVERHIVGGQAAFLTAASTFARL